MNIDISEYKYVYTCLFIYNVYIDFYRNSMQNKKVYFAILFITKLMNQSKVNKRNVKKRQQRQLRRAKSFVKRVKIGRQRSKLKNLLLCNLDVVLFDKT